MTAETPPPRLAVREITELLAWARRLSTAGPSADPTERAAYLAAKADLFARITNPDPAADPEPTDPGPRQRTPEEQR